MSEKTINRIRIDIEPEQHAQNAYDSGYFIEAIQVLHSYIELIMRELVFLTKGSRGHHENYDLANDTMFEIPLNMAVKVLFIQSEITKNERDELIFFNSSRNEIVHQVYGNKIHSGQTGFPKDKYDKAFKVGLKLTSALTEKVYAIMK